MTDLDYTIKLRIYRGEKVFGPGMAELLENIMEHGSLRAAATAMGMAYSKAWKVLRTAESSLAFPLLRAQTGGKGGGGMVLTPQGVAFLSAYRAFEADVHKQAAKTFSAHFEVFIVK